MNAKLNTMTKTAKTTATFSIGDRVTVTTAATGGEPLAGTIEQISKGWYLIELDEAIENAKGEESTTVSARLSSLALLDDEQDDDDEIDGEYHDDLDENGNPIQLDDEQSEDGDVEDALDEAEEHASRMAEALRKARVRYKKDKRPDGKATAHCDDLIARELRDYDPKEVAGIADRCFDLPKGTHEAKYCHLNPGQIRMNCGNRIRGVWRKGEDIDRMTRIAQVLGLEDELAEMLAAKAERAAA